MDENKRRNIIKGSIAGAVLLLALVVFIYTNRGPDLSEAIAEYTPPPAEPARPTPADDGYEDEDDWEDEPEEEQRGGFFKFDDE